MVKFSRKKITFLSIALFIIAVLGGTITYFFMTPIDYVILNKEPTVEHILSQPYEKPTSSQN